MRIVMDISTSIAWRARAVGVVRTERELIRRFLRDISEGRLKEDFFGSDHKAGLTYVVFCSYNKFTKNYHRVSFAQAAQTISPEWEDPTHSFSNDSQIESSNAVSHQLSGLKKILRMFLSTRLRPAVVELANKLRGKIVDVLPQGLHSALTPDSDLNLGKGDCYLSVGADWQYNDHEVLFRMKKELSFRVILCCYDLIPILVPHLAERATALRFENYIANLCHTASDIACISETTAKDLRLYIEENDIETRASVHAILLGDDVSYKSVTPVEGLIADSFFLYVSTIEARKNHWSVLKAWEILAADNRFEDKKLVLVGSRAWGTQDLITEMQYNPLLRDRVLHLQKLPDEQLAWLYENCSFTVFPSLYEGWGLAATESLRCKKPCIIADTPALLEATQNLMPSVHPFDVLGWKNEIQKNFHEKSYHKTLVSRAKKYKPRSWDQYYNEILGVIGA
jgi:hypothetical protein